MNAGWLNNEAFERKLHIGMLNAITAAMRSKTGCGSVVLKNKHGADLLHIICGKSRHVTFCVMNPERTRDYTHLVMEDVAKKDRPLRRLLDKMGCNQLQTL